jgi:hypothetical protein
MKPQYERFLEGNANALRAKCGTGAFDRLDPFTLATIMEVQVVRPVQSAFDHETWQKVFVDGKDTWDGGTMILPDGSRLVVLNPTRGMIRQRATLMEELCHLHLGHEPSRLIVIGGFRIRSVNQANERAAYQVGAAALLPARVLKGAKTRAYTAEQVAETHGVSMPLLKMRENFVGVHLLRNALVEVA